MIAGLGQLLLASAYTQEAERDADAMAAQMMDGDPGHVRLRAG